MMIIVCPYSFGFCSSWVTDCDTPVAQSEFVTEVGRRGQLFGDSSITLPRSWASGTLCLNMAELSLIPSPPRNRVAMRNQPWRGGLMCISGSFSPHGPDTLKALPRGALFLGHLRDEKPRPAEHRTGLSHPQR